MDAPEWAAIRSAGKARRRCGPFARKEEQRGQGAEVRLNRVRSALTRSVKSAVRKKLSNVNVLPAVGSGQLRFLGSWLPGRVGIYDKPSAERHWVRLFSLFAKNLRPNAVAS